MAMRVPRMPALLKDGYKMSQGIDEAVLKNIDACKQLGTLVKSSYGPNGMNKMVINHLEKLFVTNDAATIMRELEVAHPAARLLVMASQQQEQEVGDCTNWVVILAAELLAKSAELLRIGVHSADIIEGYEIAYKKALELLDNEVLYTVENLANATDLILAVRSAIGSKQYGYDEYLSQLVVEACLEVMPHTPKYFNVDSVRVVKVLGGNVLSSSVVRGMLFNREPEGDIKSVTNAKVAIFSCGFDIQQTETKGTVLLKNAGELLNFSKGEEAQLEGMVKEIADAGVKVVVVSSGVGELALHFANRYGLVIVKCLSKFDLRRLCKVTGATALTRLGAPMAEEMGNVDVLETVEIGSDRCTVFRQTESSKTRTVTVVLRGATQNSLDDLERAVDDGVNTVKLLTRDGRLLAGAGAVEVSLAKRLYEEVGEKLSGVAAYGVKAFAEALESIPRVLANNAGLDATGVISLLYAKHSKGERRCGVNIEAETAIGQLVGLDEADQDVHVVKDVTVCTQPGDYCIYDSYAAKYWAIKYAADAALTVLRVDQIIMSKAAGGPKMPKGGNQAYDDDQMA